MKKIKNWFHQPVFALVCYVFALLSLGYTIYTLMSSYDYIVSLVEQGQVSWSTDLSNIVSYFVGNSASYLFYAFALMFFGIAINALKPKMVKEEVEMVEEVAVDNQEVEKIEEVVVENEEAKIVEEVKEEKVEVNEDLAEA